MRLKLLVSFITEKIYYPWVKNKDKTKITTIMTEKKQQKLLSFHTLYK